METTLSHIKGAEAVLFDDMNGLEDTELRLGLPGTSSSTTKTKRLLDNQDSMPCCADETTALGPAPKSQIVGWPPVQSFRRNVRHNFHNAASKPSPATKEPPTTTPSTQTPARANPAALLVKVSMDGAPYLRKVDLGAYTGYKDLRLALDAMFRSAPRHQLTYEDEDGDWMLVGDVPWEMFAASCKRLRIVKAFSGANMAGSVE